MKASLFYLPTIGSRAEIEAGMAGMNPDFYQRMLGELTEQIKLGDELGYDSVSFTEHHFHIEGFELSNNPVLLDLYFAMQTKRIRVGQLGIVLPASNPIRVAEDIAMLDHMTGGRANAGFAKLKMQKDLAFDDGVFGWGFGIFFAGYLLLEIPGALLVEHWSARKWFARILFTWGLC